MILLIRTSNIYLYNIKSLVSFERHYFVLYDGGLTLKLSKMLLNPFCDKTLHKLDKTIAHACKCVLSQNVLKCAGRRLTKSRIK